MTIKKMTVCINVAMFITIAIVLAALFSLNNSVSTLSRTSDNRANLLELAGELLQSSASLTSNVRMYAVTGDEKYVDIYNSIVAERAGEIPRANDKNILPGEKHNLVELIRQHGANEEELAYVQKASSLSNNLIPLEVEAMHLVKGEYKDTDGNYTVKGQPDREKAMELVFGPQYEKAVAPIAEQLDLFVKELDERQTALVGQEHSKVEQMSLVTYACLLLTLLAAIFSMWYSLRRVVAPLEHTLIFTDHVTKGDLDRVIDTSATNEIGKLNRALDTMVENLKLKISEAEQQADLAHTKSEEALEAIKKAEAAQKEAEHAKRDGMLAAAAELEDIVKTISLESDELAEKITQAEKGTSIQADRIAGTATAMEEMNSTVLEVAKNASTASEISAGAHNKATEGSEVVQKSVNGILLVQEQSLKLKRDMTQLDEHAQAITQIMNVISDIADQTNLLALNAAIEAARAGEAGRGFAVVADEVRKLAEKTMTSTADVSQAIKAIQQSAAKSIEQMDASVKAIEEATEYANNSGEALKEIVEMVDSTAEQVEAIATAAEEQSSTSDEINRSIAEVNSIATEMSTSMQEAAESVSKLASQAHSLNSLIENMKKH